MRNQFEVAIRQKNSKSAAMSMSFEIPANLWEQWYHVGFNIKLGEKSQAVNDVSVESSEYIMVKKRWYHKFYETIYFKFKQKGEVHVITG